MQEIEQAFKPNASPGEVHWGQSINYIKVIEIMLQSIECHEKNDPSPKIGN